MDAESGGLGIAIGSVATAVIGGVVNLVKGKRDDRSQATEEWRELAREARSEREKCEANQAELRVEINALRETVLNLTLEHGGCPGRIESLEQQVRELQRQSEPPEEVA